MSCGILFTRAVFSRGAALWLCGSFCCGRVDYCGNAGSCDWLPTRLLFRPCRVWRLLTTGGQSWGSGLVWSWVEPVWGVWLWVWVPELVLAGWWMGLWLGFSEGWCHPLAGRAGFWGVWSWCGLLGGGATFQCACLHRLGGSGLSASPQVDRAESQGLWLQAWGSES